MTRRSLLQMAMLWFAQVSSLVGARRAAAQTAATPAQPAVRSPIIDDLASHFSYLKIEPGVLAAFATAYETHYGSPNLNIPQIAAGMHTRFLLSTDFFQNGANETKPVKFVALYDPYVTPCYNPLARFG